MKSICNKFSSGHLNAIATQDIKALSVHLLKNALNSVGSFLRETLFISTEMNQELFFEVTNTDEEHLFYDYSKKVKNGEMECNSIILPKASLLFIDLPDNSVVRKETDYLDIEHIHSLIVSIKKKHQLFTVVIDNIDKVQCTLMGRESLWRTNISNAALYEDWKERRHEYIISLLYWLAAKYHVRIFIGKEMKSDISTPVKLSDLKYIPYGNSSKIIENFMFFKEVINEKSGKKTVKLSKIKY